MIASHFWKRFQGTKCGPVPCFLPPGKRRVNERTASSSATDRRRLALGHIRSPTAISSGGLPVPTTRHGARTRIERCPRPDGPFPNGGKQWRCDARPLRRRRGHRSVSPRAWMCEEEAIPTDESRFSTTFIPDMTPASSVSPDSSSFASNDYDTELLLVDAKDEHAVAQHPEVASLVQMGWRIRRSEPRVVESDCKTQFLVVMERTSEDESLSVAET